MGRMTPRSLKRTFYGRINITLSGLQTIDGTALAANALLLVKNQSIAAQNGIYKVSSGVWAREGTLTGGMLVAVRGGTAQGQTVWMLTTPDPIVAGTTALTFKGTGAFYG
jgi:hypothetical protein